MPKPDSPPGQDQIPPGQMKPMPPGQDKPPKEEVPIDPATGKEFKKGEVPPGKNEPVGGEFKGTYAEQQKLEAAAAEVATKEAEEKAEKDHKREEKDAAKAAKENSPD